jgi:hypothetical protein
MSLLTRWWTTFFVASLDREDPAEALVRRPLPGELRLQAVDEDLGHDFVLPVGLATTAKTDGLMFSWLQRTLETLDVKANS